MATKERSGKKLSSSNKQRDSFDRRSRRGWSKQSGVSSPAILQSFDNV